MNRTGASSHPGNAPEPPDAEAVAPAGSTHAEPGKDDGVLDSVGKAIASPVRGAAEPEEPDPDEGEAPGSPG